MAELERKKLGSDSERPSQHVVHLDAETRDQAASERALLAAEFRKAASQLGELRRRETHILHRVAILELERRNEKASLEAQSAESARLNGELADALHRITESDRALETQTRQFELELRHEQVLLQAQSTDSARLNAELADARDRITKLDRALEAQARREQVLLEAQSAESAHLNAELADARHRIEELLGTQSAESARLNAQLTDARRRISELELALVAQERQLELKRRQADARRGRTEDLEAGLEARSAEVAGLNAVLTDARRHIVELTSALGAEITQVESVKMSTSWTLTLPVRRFAEKYPWLGRQLRNVLKFFSAILTFSLGSRAQNRTRRKQNAKLAHARLLASSKSFDRDWYLGQYGDVRVADIDPVLHYLEYGASEGRNPSALFDSNWYMQQNPDVRNAGMNPLIHYLMHGAAEGRPPRP